MAESITDELLAWLQGNPHRTFSAEELASITGWSSKQCTGALGRLCNTYTDVARPTRGLYWYHPSTQPEFTDAEFRQTAASEPEPEPEPEPLFEGGGGALQLLRAVGRAPLPEVIEAAPAAVIPVGPNTNSVPTFFEAMTTDEHGRIVLRDDKGRMWVAFRMVPEL